MAIQLDTCKAICLSCQKEGLTKEERESLEGQIYLSLISQYRTDYAQVEGSLIHACGDHHNTNRIPVRRGCSKPPQHNMFMVSKEGKIIGELGPVASDGGQSKINILNKKIRSQLRKQR